MSWLEICLEIESTLAEKCSELLESLGALAISFFDASNQPIFEPPPGTTPLWEKVQIVGLFPENADMAPLRQTLMSRFPDISLTIKALAEQDWGRKWLEHFKPMRFGKSLWILPSDFAAPEEDDATVVRLDPGLAFGTGTHSTTALCLQWLDANPPVGQTVIDYGCGSGILGVAALKLGAQKVWAVDYDPQAITATKDNAKNNGIVADQLIAISPEELPHPLPQGQTVIANILAEPLVTLAETLSACCTPGGQIVLSGFLTHQVDMIKTAYAPWFAFDTEIKQEEWVLLAGKKHADN